MKKYLFSSPLAFIASAVKMQFFVGSCVQLPAGQVIVLKEDSPNDTELLKAIANNAVAVNHNFVGAGLTATQIVNRINHNQDSGLASAGLEPVVVTRKARTFEHLVHRFGGIYGNYPDVLTFDVDERFPVLTVQGYPIENNKVQLCIGLEEAKALIERIQTPQRFAGFDVNAGLTLKLGTVIGEAAPLLTVLEKFVKWFEESKARDFAAPVDAYEEVATFNPQSVQGIAQRLRLKPSAILDAYDGIRTRYYNNDSRKRGRDGWGQPSETTLLRKMWLPLIEDYFGIPQS